jgi:hypothetical protein
LRAHIYFAALTNELTLITMPAVYLRGQYGRLFCPNAEHLRRFTSI